MDSDAPTTTHAQLGNPDSAAFAQLEHFSSGLFNCTDRALCARLHRGVHPLLRTDSLPIFLNVGFFVRVVVVRVWWLCLVVA